LIREATAIGNGLNREAALMLKEEDIGWVTRPEDSRDLAAVIRSAASDREGTLAKGRRAAVVAPRYTYDQAIATYRLGIEEVMCNRRVAGS
jgi:colanic acid biosynthesis glycosyl transferase WcaI